jgi:signal transduction histidine kinase/ActR/RegA family two-component response regulator
MPTNANRKEDRILLLAPTRRDGEVTSALLSSAGLSCGVCRDLNGLSNEIEAGAGAILLTEEALTASGIAQLLAAIRAQPSWSQLPIVLLMRGGAQSTVAASVLQALGNVMLLERPAPTRTVVSALVAAVRARQRQYQIRDQLEEIHRAEIRARDLQEQLARLLSSERAARAEAERVSQMKDEFLATLSHELRTPLNAIYGWTQILRMGAVDSQTIEEGIAVIDRNVRAQTQLIEDLLDMSRIASGKVRLDMQPVDLVDVLQATVEAVRPAVEAKQLRLDKVIDPTAGPVSGDPGRLQQVFWNLMTNAIKFTPPGGSIQVLTRRADSHVEISVCDSGEGISPEFLPRLFDRFSQADGSSKRKHGGLGLGLSIVKNLVELHGGSVRAESAGEGLGATFLIRLPLRVAGALNQDVPRAPGGLSTVAFECGDLKLDGLKILVVDDESDARDLVRRFLVECGATPALAASVAEAQELVERFAPDIIISDIGMPERDGYDFIRELRTKGCKTPAVALTAFARAEDRIRSIQSGYQTHLPKPIEPAELVAVVASLAGRYQKSPQD